MKRKDILKAIIIVFLAYAVLSWIIPVGGYTSGSFTTSTTDPIGLFDLIKYPIVNLTSSVFVLTAIVILFTGGLYGVLNKTGAYSGLVNAIAKKYDDKGEVFLTLSIILFSVLASLTGLVLPLFVIVPLFATIILLLGYSKITALISTIGAILVGNMASTYGFNINGYISYFYGTSIHATIWYRIALLITVTVALILFTIKTSKKKETKKIKDEDIPLYEKTKSNKKSTAIVVTLCIMMVLTLVGMYNWVNALNISFFDDIYVAITDFKIKGYPLFANLLGSINSMGYWSNYELALILVLTSLIIGKIYKLSIKDICSSFMDGCKEVLPVAIYAILANLLFLLMNSNSNGYTLYATICNYLFTITSKLNIAFVGLSSIIGGVLYNDFPYMVNAVYSQVASLTENVKLVALVQQAVHGLVSLIAPTSVILVAGLTYLDVSYKEWLKNIWKYLLISLLIALIIIVIMMVL